MSKPEQCMLCSVISRWNASW